MYGRCWVSTLRENEGRPHPIRRFGLGQSRIGHGIATRFIFYGNPSGQNIEGTSQSKTSNTKKQTLVFTISLQKNVSLKTKNPRQLLAGRHFFSTLNLPFNQHPCPAILFLRLPQIFSLRLCVSAFSPFSV